MSTNLKQSVENGIIVFTVHITRWSANKKLRPQHTKAKVEDLPPTDLASLGVRKVFDPKALAPFEAIRKEVERLCFSEGTGFFGGVAIPKIEAETFAKKLKALQDRFNNAKATFEQQYEDSLAAWRAAHPGWEQTMEGALEVQEALSRFTFSFHAVEIVMAGTVENTEPGTELEQNIQSSKGAFIGQLYAEIAQMANTYRKDSLLGKEKASARGLSALAAMRKKLSGLAFLDQRIRPLVDMIAKVEAEMPPSGSIDGAQFATLLGVTSILSDKDMMQQYGEQVATGKEEANSLFKFLTTPVQPKATAQPAVQQQVPSTMPGAIQPGVPSFGVPINQQPPVVPAVPVASGWGFIPTRA